VSDEWLFFVDTNVFLDFYRMPGASVKRQLEGLEHHVDRLIFGDQVRMEFLKNRQKVLLKAIGELKKPVGATGIPQVFSELQVSKTMTKHLKSADSRFKDLKLKGEKMLSDPSHNDPIYVSFNRLFNSKTKLNLCRPKKERFEVRSRARKRFVLGYPPRKSGDTSIGDSVNWEWIISCAINSERKPHIMIVSRDGDFGVTTDSGVYLNDWLDREFKERVSRKRQIVLTNRLTDALKLMDEKVSEDDVRAEDNLKAGTETQPNDPLLDLSAEDLEYILEAYDED
jgi:predicted nucleic acid-binding protein